MPRGAAFESPDVEDDDYADGRVAAETIKRLAGGEGATRERMARRSSSRPGSPGRTCRSVHRKKYWDLYDPAALPMPEFEELPAGAPAVAGKRGGEITQLQARPGEGRRSISDELKRKLIHGYYASTSFVDAQIGKVIDELDRLELADNTIVVLWGDHGFHLGDLGIWTKHTNYEQANRIPILISAPGVDAARFIDETACRERGHLSDAGGTGRAAGAGGAATDRRREPGAGAEGSRRPGARPRLSRLPKAETRPRDSHRTISAGGVEAFGESGEIGGVRALRLRGRPTGNTEPCSGQARYGRCDETDAREIPTAGRSKRKDTLAAITVSKVSFDHRVRRAYRGR